ncbi:hypothetical protein FPV67DRAFT_1475582 [Lyophyllum atratum]|nr:hypothetical protein FPV67DRAFT_1475582 [Lyophyllum atratum]
MNFAVDCLLCQACCVNAQTSWSQSAARQPLASRQDIWPALGDLIPSSWSSSTMISDMYVVRNRTPSSMNSSNSANSFDFVGVLDDEECQLLSPSISMGSLWSIDSDDTVPPFPDRPTPLITPILLDDRSMLFPRGRSKVGPVDYKILTTMATPPRMKNLLLEPLCVNLWVDTIIMMAPPPGLVPWEPATHVTERSWVPAGSLYPPNRFKQALRYARSSPKTSCATPATFGSIERRPSRPSSSSSSSQQGSDRKALVFEREITVSTGSKKERWSLQVPAAAMNPEMVDIMLELQDLNSFFKDSLEDLDESAAVLGYQKEKLDPPSLMISDSHSTFPLSIEPPTHLQRGPPIPLAARRGKALLPPLSLTETRLENAYASIPTAFLGSPSAYSPKFEYGNAQGDPSICLEEMITNLRSQCHYPRRADGVDFDLDNSSPVSAMTFAAASDQENTDDDDDWAFAVSFLDEFRSEVPGVDDSRKSGHSDFESALQAPSQGLGKGSNLLPTELSTPRAQSPVYVPPSPVPSTPLPATPAMQRASISQSSSPKDVRGILKSCKNVRFASLPDKSVEDKIEAVALPSTPLTTALPVTVPPERPSRIRAYSRSSKHLKENAPVLVTPRAHRPISAYVAAGTKPQKVSSTRPVSMAPSTPVDPSQSKKPTLPGHKPTPPLPSSRHNAVLARKSTPISLGRQSLGRAAAGGFQQESETQGGTFPRGKAGSRWTMNDMTFRRGSNASQQSPEGTPKSRMPVPLRNILTRFK